MGEARVTGAGTVSGAEAGGLVTTRLRLRPLAVAEARAVAAGERLGGWAEDFPDEASAEQVPWSAGEPPAVDPFGHRLVVERESGLVVGSVGLEGGHANDQAEVLFGIVPSRRGRGYASEAVEALVAHAFAVSAVVEVIAFVELANAASLRALERAGFAHNGFPPVDGTAILEVRRV